MTNSGVQAEVERIERVSDMLCTSHATLRDRYARRALCLDLTILGLSTWLVAMSFVGPEVAATLTPVPVAPHVWIGLLCVATFFMSIVQLYVSWKEKASAHERSLHFYSEIKREAKYLLATQTVTPDTLRILVDRNTMASTGAVGIPDALFLELKARHKTKVAISRHLDTHPAAFLPYVRLCMWFTDTFRK